MRAETRPVRLCELRRRICATEVRSIFVLWACEGRQRLRIRQARRNRLSRRGNFGLRPAIPGICRSTGLTVLRSVLEGANFRVLEMWGLWIRAAFRPLLSDFEMPHQKARRDGHGKRWNHHRARQTERRTLHPRAAHHSVGRAGLAGFGHDRERNPGRTSRPGKGGLSGRLSLRCRERRKANIG